MFAGVAHDPDTGMPKPICMRPSNPAGSGKMAAVSPYRIAFVCLGNICRSPIAKVVMRSLVDEAGLGDRVQVASAGTGDWHVGRRADERTLDVLTSHGYDGSRHRARQFEKDWFDDDDLVLALDRSNLADLQALAAPDQVDKVQLLLS